MSTKKRRYGLKSRFTAYSLMEAMDKIRSKTMSVTQASVLYNIPGTTLRNKLKLKHMKPVGRPCVLSDSEEETFVQNILACIESGVLISPKDIRHMLKDYLDKKNRSISFLRDNMPSWEWIKTFLERHEDLRNVIFCKRKKKKAYITLRCLHRFFDKLENDVENILPENIYNFIEIKLCDSKKTNAVMSRKQFHTPALTLIKSHVTVIFCSNAAGCMLPPYVVYKSSKICNDWLLGAPNGTQCIAKIIGYLDEEAFRDWLHRIVLPFLSTNNNRKIILGDELSCHISNTTLEMLNAHNIKIIQIPSEATHVLQPLEIHYIEALKIRWWAILNAWKNTAEGRETYILPKAKFANLLNKTLQLGKSKYISKIIAGFKESGVYPTDRNEVLQKIKQSQAHLYENRVVRKNSQQVKVIINDEYCSEIIKDDCTFETIDVQKSGLSELNNLNKLTNKTQDSAKHEMHVEYNIKDDESEMQIVLTDGSFCLVNFECSLFPAKIITVKEECCDLIVMQKYYVGWSLPQSLNSICQYKIEDIVKVLLNDQVIENEIGFIINDEDLHTEWGE